MGYYVTNIFLIISFTLFYISSLLVVESRITSGGSFKTMSGPSMSNGEVEGTRWAVLVAGSYGYGNYRHQADVCHAYQLLKNNRLKDDNIIVFMYDDIAFNVDNPRPGVIINHPDGDDVYEGVPKDYTGNDTSINNLFAVILGNKTAVKGGSGKVVNSGPNDHIFFYYAGHGGAGAVLMPTDEELYGKDLIDVLKKKHASETYKSMVIYLEACESGSMFEGLLPQGLNIYAVTASNASENSWEFYCPGSYPPPPPEYKTCLGDLFSISWLEDSDKSNLGKETLEMQYQVVKRRTGYTEHHSHVMQYGSIKELSNNVLSVYMGANSNKQNYVLKSDHISIMPMSTSLQTINQRDASILYLQTKFSQAPEGSEKWVKAQQELTKEIAHRNHLDRNIEAIGEILFGSNNGVRVLKTIRQVGQPLVDDWDCLMALVGIYKQHCGSLSRYGIKHMRAFANMCNAGVGKDQMAQASTNACT